MDSREMGVESLCRACFTPSKTMYPIFAKIEDEPGVNIVTQVLEMALEAPILPMDSASHNICIKCFKMIHKMHSFMLLCKQSDLAFRQLDESQVRVKKLKDPREFLEYIIDENEDDSTMATNNEDINDVIALDGYYSNAEPQVFDLTVDSENEIQSGEEEAADEILECPACLDAFGMISVLRTHLIEVHTMDSMCIMCNNELFDDIWAHTKMHVPKSHVCNFCGKKFIRRDSLQRHFETHVELNESVTCEICQTEFPAGTDLDGHIIAAHPHICKICLKSFSSRKNLARHRKIHSKNADHVGEMSTGDSETMGKYTGDMNSSYQNDDSTYSVEEPHAVNYKPEIIMSANEVFNYDQTSDTMMDLFGEPEGDTEERVETKKINYQCNICLKPFRDKQCLKDHSTVHTGERPFECQVCGKSFRVKRNLRQHLISHSTQSPFVCGFCGSRYKKGVIILAHIKQKHRNEKIIPCGLCPEVFGHTKDLSRHWRFSHTLSYADVNVESGHTVSFKV